MTTDAIIKYIDAKDHSEKALNIHFKTRSTITGLFIRGNDFQELQSKNFWRIVTSAHLEQWEKTKNMNLSKIFSGSEFTKLSEN